MTRDIYSAACQQSKELYAITEEERTHLQAHLRMMYKEIEKICDRHNLRMCAGYGTVLGAVRHKGFIPWDDDIDLLMPREDYDKLIHNYANELPQYMKVYAPNSDNGALYRFAKIVDTRTLFMEATDIKEHGIFIDIFPLENAPCSPILLKWRNIYTRFLLLIAACVYQHTGKNMLYKRIMCASKQGNWTYQIRNIIGWAFSIMSVENWYNYIANYTHYKEETGLVNIPTDGGFIKSLTPYPIDSYFPASRADFDDIEIYVPKDTINYLKRNYGNWQLIPKDGEQWQHYLAKIEFNIQ